MIDEKQVRYAEQYPAFKGAIELDLGLEILGERFTRRLRVEYKHTPEDEHYDLRKLSLQPGCLVSAISLYSRAEPEPHDPDQREFDWIALDSIIPLLPDDLLDKIHQRVGEHCLEEDARRRKRFLVPDSGA
jgi:hypothetical protein